MNVTRSLDLERLANRLALLVSADSEADNAGRAVGAMARRIGLSGGDLKAMFLAGAVPGGRSTPGADRRAASLQESVGQLQAGLQDSERKLRSLGQQLHEARQQADRAHARMKLERIAAAAVLVLLLGGVAAWVGMAADGRALQSGIPAKSPLAHMARVGSAGATVYAGTDTHSAILAQLSPGTPFPVHALVWHSLNQWAQSSIGPFVGYVSANELQLP